MPIAISNRSISNGNGSLMTPLVANNPAFKVEILPVDGRLEQKPFAKDDSTRINSIKVGDTVRGHGVNNGGAVKGKVLQVNRQNGQIVSYKILSEEGEEVLLDPTSTEKYFGHGEEVDVTGGVDVNDLPTNGVPNESHRVLNYSSWLNESGLALK
jgi:hypothetical protein